MDPVRLHLVTSPLVTSPLVTPTSESTHPVSMNLGKGGKKEKSKTRVSRSRILGSGLPGIFQETFFTRPSHLSRSLFMRPMHPKSEIRPTPEAIEKVLKLGWVGQLKIHGHRAQIHISADPNEEPVAFNRQGQIHGKAIPPTLISELKRIFSPQKDWNVIDAEWIKSGTKGGLKVEDRLYVFDFLKRDGETLHRLNFLDRWKLLPRAYISPLIQNLGIFNNLEQCLEALKRPEEMIEGLVFKSASPGFEDSSIIRCRR